MIHNIPLHADNWRSEFKRLEGAYAPATMRSYIADVEAFEAWCHENHHISFPATVETVCRFLEDQGREKAPSTVRRRLYAIRKVHRFLRLDDPTYDEEINMTFRRVRRTRYARPKQAKGLTKVYLEAFLAVQPDNPWALRNRAMLSLGYELLARRSEPVALKTEDITFLRDGTARVIIKRSKTDPYGHGRIAFTSVATAKAVQDWLEWRGQKITYLFCPIYKSKAVDRDLSTSTVKRLVKSAAKAAGLEQDAIDTFSGHSLRVGAA